MAETVDVFGQDIPTRYVWVGGAVVVGIVGYAWWTQGRQSKDEFLTEEDITSGALDVVGDERFPMDADTPSGPFGTPPATNAEWVQTALERMQALGIGGGDLSAASSAIGKFLARDPLSKVEADLVRQAIAHAGFPPQNGPWVIIEATKPPPSGGGNGNGATAPAPPTNVKMRFYKGKNFVASWDRSTTPGVKYRWRIHHMNGNAVSGWKTTSGTKASGRVASKTRYYIQINAYRNTAELNAGIFSRAYSGKAHTKTRP